MDGGNLALPCIVAGFGEFQSAQYKVDSILLHVWRVLETLGDTLLLQ